MEPELTPDEVRALFGEVMPMTAVLVLMDGQQSSAEKRATLQRLALDHRLPLKPALAAAKENYEKLVEIIEKKYKGDETHLRSQHLYAEKSYAVNKYIAESMDAEGEVSENVQLRICHVMANIIFDIGATFGSMNEDEHYGKKYSVSFIKTVDFILSKMLSGAIKQDDEARTPIKETLKN